MAHWTDDFYRRIDSGDHNIGDMLSDDIAVQVANFPPSRGKEALPLSALSRLSSAARSVKHETVHRWDVTSNKSVFEFRVTYVRLDGRSVTVPVVTIIQRDATGKIDDLRLFMDGTPLWEGVSARIVMGGIVPVNPPGSSRKVGRDAIWDALVQKANNATVFVPNITKCEVIERGNDIEGKEWIVREIVVDGIPAQERVVFYPQERITFTRTRGEQMGTIHNLLDERDGELILSFQFDLTWHGMPAGSLVAKAVGEGMRQGYSRTFAIVCDNLRNNAQRAA